MKYLIYLFVFIICLAIAFSFFGGLGYATGGGTIYLFPKTITAESTNGQAIAVGGDVGTINANNTPPIQTNEDLSKSRNDLASVVGVILLFSICLFVIIQILRHIGIGKDNYDYSSDLEKYI